MPLRAERRSGIAALACTAILAACSPEPAPPSGATTTATARYIAIPAGTIASALANDAAPGAAAVAAFSLRETPVTQGEFGRFVAAHPEWRRDRVPKLFANGGYLRSWPAPDRPATDGDAAERTPVTDVSWFAAQAYCESEGARLPTWLEWEYVAAADAKRRDARADAEWLARILAWYARPATDPLPAVGGAANVYGVRDVHGVVWEWVDDFASLLVEGDSRTGDDPDKLKFCGAGAINLKQRENYAVLMRIALLSSLDGAGSTGSLGFRCARPLQHQEQP